MADNQHFRYINKLPHFKEIYGNSKRCLKAYSYTRKEHWTWSTNMAAMASKFNFECVIQYYTDQWLQHDIEWPHRSPDLTPRDFLLWGYTYYETEIAHIIRDIIDSDQFAYKGYHNTIMALIKCQHSLLK